MLLYVPAGQGCQSKPVPVCVLMKLGLIVLDLGMGSDSVVYEDSMSFVEMFKLMEHLSLSCIIYDLPIQTNPTLQTSKEF